MKKTIPFILVLIMCISCDSNKKETVGKENQVSLDSIYQEVKDSINNVYQEEIEEVHDYEKHEVVFTVQIAALPKENNDLENYEDVKVYYEDGYVKYRIGAFSTYQEALEQKQFVKTTFPDAFIQALKHNDPIHIREALNLH